MAQSEGLIAGFQALHDAACARFEVQPGRGSQKAIAHHLGVQEAQYSDALRGHRGSLQLLREWAGKLDLRVTLLPDGAISVESIVHDVLLELGPSTSVQVFRLRGEVFAALPLVLQVRFDGPLPAGLAAYDNAQAVSVRAKWGGHDAQISPARINAVCWSPGCMFEAFLNGPMAL